VADSLNRRYFDDIYASSPDPWRFETSWYERRKYAVTLAALPEERYQSAFEPGCSVGVLTEQLSQRCDRLLASDIVPDALARAQARFPEDRDVVFENRAIPESWPEGPFDLVVLSEIAYYFDSDDLREIGGCVAETTSSGATVIAVHWRGSTNYPLSGDRAHRVLGSGPTLVPHSHYEEADFLLDVWTTR
jgi:trans-aconitate methyltransferase